MIIACSSHVLFASEGTLPFFANMMSNCLRVEYRRRMESGGNVILDRLSSLYVICMLYLLKRKHFYHCAGMVYPCARIWNLNGILFVFSSYLMQLCLQTHGGALLCGFLPIISAPLDVSATGLCQIMIALLLAVSAGISVFDFCHVIVRLLFIIVRLVFIMVRFVFS